MSSSATTPATLYNLHYFWTEGLVKAPLFIQTVFRNYWAASARIRKTSCT